MDLCPHCDEPVLPGEDTKLVSTDNVERPWHLACFLRGVLGSVGHQQGKCECHGRTDISEAGMTKREAAEAAMAYHFTQTNRPLRHPASEDGAGWYYWDRARQEWHLFTSGGTPYIKPQLAGTMVVWMGKEPMLPPTSDAPFKQGFEVHKTLEGDAIRCLRCGRTSHNSGDVQHQYCGNCGAHG